MEESHNQRLPNNSGKQTREDDSDIISGARQSDQLEKMQNKAKAIPEPADNKQGTPAVVRVNNGESPHPKNS